MIKTSNITEFNFRVEESTEDDTSPPGTENLAKTGGRIEGLLSRVVRVSQPKKRLVQVIRVYNETA